MCFQCACTTSAYRVSSAEKNWPIVECNCRPLVYSMSTYPEADFNQKNECDQNWLISTNQLLHFSGFFIISKMKSIHELSWNLKNKLFTCSTAGLKASDTS